MFSQKSNARPFYGNLDVSLAGAFSLLKTAALLLLLIAPLVCPRTVSAQDIFGRIAGTVTDASGAVVPDAKVSLVNESTQARRDLTTNRNGYFAADEVSVGTYSVVVEKAGFKTLSKRGNVLDAGARLTVDLSLQVGTVTETVSVVAAGEAVNTTSGEISTTITQDQIQNLALNQRHYETLLG